MASSFVTRRGLVGGIATALGVIGPPPSPERRGRGLRATAAMPLSGSEGEYDAFATLANDATPYGPEIG